MKQTNRSERTTIRVRPDILELANDIKKERGYSIADIFEMGVLLLDNNNENDLIIQDKMYSEMIHRFSRLEENIHKECETIQNKILKEISNLENERSVISKTLSENGLNYTQEVVEETILSILDVIKIREENIRYGISVEPLGKEFFEYKSKISGIPINVLLNELEKKGYTQAELKKYQINPEIKWRGTVELKKETMI